MSNFYDFIGQLCPVYAYELNILCTKQLENNAIKKYITLEINRKIKISLLKESWLDKSNVVSKIFIDQVIARY